MAVYLDDWRQRAVIRGVEERWSHLIGDDRDELRAFAGALGVPARAFQDHAWRWHYDVPESHRTEVLALGAHAVGWRDVGLMLRARRRSMLEPPPRVERVDVVGAGEDAPRVGRVLAMRLGAELVTAAPAVPVTGRPVVAVDSAVARTGSVEITSGDVRFAYDRDARPVSEAVEHVVAALAAAMR